MQCLLCWWLVWNLDVCCGEEVFCLYICGECGGDVSLFLELCCEVDIFSLFGEQGILVLYIYGFCEDLLVIVMELVFGICDVGIVVSDEECCVLVCQYVCVMVVMY